MRQINFELSNNEKQILETLWRENKSLTRSEIIDLTYDKTWKESSIHVLLNQLLTKKAIQTDSGMMYQYRVRIGVTPTSGGYYSNRALLWLTEAEALVNKNKFVDKLVEELID